MSRGKLPKVIEQYTMISRGGQDFVGVECTKHISLGQG